MSRIEAVTDITSPFGGHHHHHHGRVEGEIIAAEVAAAEINVIERERLRQMEMAAGGAYMMPPGCSDPYYPPASGYGVC